MTCPRCASRPDTAFESGCTCDHRGFPPCEDIAPGLAGLPAPLPGFDDYREHLLSSAADKPALAGWTARSEDDLGVMLLEGWAYVLDIVRFYDRRIASNSYLRTASDPLALRRLVALIGYRPRPAVAAKATLAVVASGRDPVLVPAGTRFRSKDSDGVPAQIFETAAPARIDPRHNGWELAPRRPGAYQGLLAFASEAPGLLAGQFVFIAIAGRAAPTAARVGTLTKARMADGKDYRIVTLSPAPDFSGVTLDRIALYAMSQSASPTSFEVQESSPPSGLAGKPSALKAPLSGAAKVQMGAAAKQFAGQPLPHEAKVQLDAFTKYGEAAWEQVDLAFGDTEWVLDGIYPQIAAGDRVVVEWPTPASGAEPHLTAATVVATALASVILAAGTPPVLGKATKLTLDKRVWMRRLHFRDVNAGRLVNPALTELPLDALLGTQAAAGTAEPLGDGIVPCVFAVAGENDGGALLSGSVAVDPLGQARLSGIAIAEQAADRLRAPIRYYGNLVTVSRGETVRDEVLGSADASLLYQRFRLRQKPLSYLPDPAAPRGVAAELEVRVNGIAWKQVESFLAARQGERVYIVRHDEAGETDIVFGESARPPSGVDNVTATYRFGAGAASPPPGTLTQMADPIPDISKVVAPLRARGGADAESSESLRRNAPASTMARNRAVSLADYAAIVAAYPGVLASDVQWRWVEGAQRTGVRAWIVNDGGDVSTELAKALRTVGDLATPIRVSAAIADPHVLGIEVVIAAGYSAAAVRTAVRDRLTDSENGLLALRRAPIGGVFFRSGLARNVAEVEGVVAARSIVFDGSDMPAALTFAQGHYPAFTLTVGEAS